MLKAVKQARAAFSLLSPGDIRERAERPVKFGLVASSGDSYEAMEDFLIPAGTPENLRAAAAEQVFRAGSTNAPGDVDLELYEPGVWGPQGTYTFDPADP